MSIREFMHRFMGTEKRIALSGAGVQVASMGSLDEVIKKETVPQDLLFTTPVGQVGILKPKKWVRNTSTNRTGIIFQFTKDNAIEVHYVDQETGETTFVDTHPDASNLRLARILEFPQCRLAFVHKDDGTVDTNATIQRMNGLGYH
jgi:hypothetical protein